MSAVGTREDWQPLLQRLLTRLRRSRETPLQFEIDSPGIVAAALADHPLPDGGNAADAVEALNYLIASVLSVKEPPVAQNMGGNLSLAGWIDTLYRKMRSVHASAIDIIGLRMEGFEPCDIAARLGLGLRQLQAIMREMSANWTCDIERR